MMKTTVFKLAWGTVAALLVLAVAPLSSAGAAPGIDMACSGPGGGVAELIAAVHAANGGGGGRINLASGCTYTLVAADNGENSLPVVTSSIALNGNGATINGSGAVRIFEVDGPGGNLSLQSVTLTNGSATDFGGAVFNAGGTVTLNQSLVTTTPQ
jgi:hypothetical protein